MLKFSGFASLTSCLGVQGEAWTDHGQRRTRVGQQPLGAETFSALTPDAVRCVTDASGAPARAS